LAELYLCECYFCGGYFPMDKVKQVNIVSKPNQVMNNEHYVCQECEKVAGESKIQRMINAANRGMGLNNEITIIDGDLSIHVMKYTPPPTYGHYVWPEQVVPPGL
jgi:hypothetical protein